MDLTWLHGLETDVMRATELYEMRTIDKSEIEILRDNKVNLTDAEHRLVMNSGAVWIHGINAAPIPAVWKSVDSAGKTTYVCDTLRAYDTASTLDAAIKSFDFIKTT